MWPKRFSSNTTDEYMPLNIGQFFNKIMAFIPQSCRLVSITRDRHFKFKNQFSTSKIILSL